MLLRIRHFHDTVPLTNSMDRADEVSKIFIIYLLCLPAGSGTISIHEERRQISEPGQEQNESI